MKSKISFEELLSELETTVKALEEGNLSLENSIQMYEKGIKLSYECKKTLEEAKQKIKIINTENFEETDIECQIISENWYGL